MHKESIAMLAHMVVDRFSLGMYYLDLSTVLLSSLWNKINLSLTFACVHSVVCYEVHVLLSSKYWLAEELVFFCFFCSTVCHKLTNSIDLLTEQEFFSSSQY